MLKSYKPRTRLWGKSWNICRWEDLRAKNGWPTAYSAGSCDSSANQKFSLIMFVSISHHLSRLCHYYHHYYEFFGFVYLRRRREEMRRPGWPGCCLRSVQSRSCVVRVFSFAKKVLIGPSQTYFFHRCCYSERSDPLVSTRPLWSSTGPLSQHLNPPLKFAFDL